MNPGGAAQNNRIFKKEISSERGRKDHLNDWITSFIQLFIEQIAFYQTLLKFYWGVVDELLGTVFNQRYSGV